MTANVVSICLVICVCLSHCIEDGDDPSMYFVKDDGINSKFPPTLVRTSFEEIPLGHLRSLGYQRASDGPVRQKTGTVPPKEFFKDYVAKNIPLTIRNAVDEIQPIRTVWTDDRLQKMHGDAPVWVIKRHERSSKKPIRTSLERFLEFYKLQDIYIASTMPDELLKEIMYPDFMYCGPISRALIETELWMAYGGTGSLLHYHGDHQVHCLADGRKDFIVIESKYKSQLKMIEKHPFTGEGHSTINTEMVNMFEERQLADVPWTYTTLRAGDCLFIPAGFIHQVRSFSRSLSYTIQFAPSHNSSSGTGDLGHCPESASSELFTPLDQLDFLYTDRDGVEQLKNIKVTGANVRSILLRLIRKSKIMPFEQFQFFYNTAISKVKKKMPSARIVFNNLDSKNDGHITLEQILDYTETQLQKVANILNSVHRKSHDEL